MKIRYGFVTNSSSSSFIAVFGTSNNELIQTPENFEKSVITGEQLLENWEEIRRWNTMNDWCWVDPFPDKGTISKSKSYFVYSDCRNVNECDYGEIDEEDVDRHYEETTSFLENVKGFNFTIQQGSGRNG